MGNFRNVSMWHKKHQRLEFLVTEQIEPNRYLHFPTRAVGSVLILWFVSLD